MTFGTLFIFFYYIGLFFDPIQELAEQFNILQSAMASSERIFKLLDEKSEVFDNPKEQILGRINGKIEFTLLAYVDGFSLRLVCRFSLRKHHF